MASLQLRGQTGGSAAVSLPVPDHEPTIRTRAEFESAMIRFINDILPARHKLELQNRSYAAGASRAGTALEELRKKRRLREEYIEGGRL